MGFLFLFTPVKVNFFPSLTLAKKWLFVCPVSLKIKFGPVLYENVKILFKKKC